MNDQQMRLLMRAVAALEKIAELLETMKGNMRIVTKP